MWKLIKNQPGSKGLSSRSQERPWERGWWKVENAHVTIWKGLKLFAWLLSVFVPFITTENAQTLITFPKPPLPRNCSSSNSHLTRDFPGTPEKNEKSGTGSSCSGWSTRNDGPSFPTMPLFLTASWWPFGKPLERAGVMKECSSNWEADERFLSSAFKQLRKIFTNKGMTIMHSVKADLLLFLAQSVVYDKLWVTLLLLGSYSD